MAATRINRQLPTASDYPADRSTALPLTGGFDDVEARHGNEP